MNVSQTEFCAAILNADAQVPLGLVDQTGAPTGKRFSVYRNNVAVSLTEALEAGFPVIRKLLGDQNFKSIAGVYLRKYPPMSPLMMNYGHEFPEFLRRFPPLSHLGYLGDVAEIETALRRAYHAADAVAIEGDAIAQISPEKLPDLRLRLAPSAQLRRSQWPIFDIWCYNSRSGAPKPRAIAQDALILRPGFDPEPHLLAPGDAEFITAIVQNQTLGKSAAAAQEAAADFNLSTCLGLLLRHGAITGLEIKEDT